ncbi:MAG TPA: type II/IV secretion system protein [Gemmatimonadales bacterium]|nr:type II/IV secretion system protein [Gemmatimonadales bacterium]
MAILSPSLPPGALERLRGDSSSGSFWDRVLDSRVLSEAQVLEAVSSRCRIPVADLGSATPAAREVVPESLARRHAIVPLHVTDSALEVATANPFDVGAEQALAFATGREVRMAIASPRTIRETLDASYGVSASEGVSRLIEGMEGFEVTAVEDEQDTAEEELLRTEASSRPIIKLVEVLLADGVTSRASDIHIESGEATITVRYRIDGVLRQAMTIPRKAGVPLISRIKIISGLDIADRLRPQDGRARVGVNGTPVDLRISTLPATHGEKVVIRILNTQQTTLKLEALGLFDDEQVLIRELLNHKEGVVLCTGPTGSGKTTTLYSCIREVQAEGINIVTVEDPVEYRLGKNIVQVQVNEKQGLTFASALRSILRQDPDIVLVGEIRDLETAQIAMQASLTGHLVLSTLHTNDAPNTVTRLVDMGLEAFKIGAGLRGVIAQRLMRRLCAVCRAPMGHDELPERLQRFVAPDTRLFRAVGCGQCAQTGYRGRFSIVEILRMSPEIERLVGSGAPADRIAEAARAAGMQSLFECGLRHLLEGHTTAEELLRVADVPGVPRPSLGAELARRSTDGEAGGARAAAAAPPAPRVDEVFTGLELLEDTGEFAAPAHRGKILLVEDEDTLRRVMRDLLEQEGYRIFEARDGVEALEQVDRHAPDLVLLDLNLPNVDGYTVLSQLRSRPGTQELPVIVLSARGDEDNEVRVLRLGATDFLTKPFRPRALSARLEAVLGRRER